MYTIRHVIISKTQCGWQKNGSGQYRQFPNAAAHMGKHVKANLN